MMTTPTQARVEPRLACCPASSIGPSAAPAASHRTGHEHMPALTEPRAQLTSAPSVAHQLPLAVPRAQCQRYWAHAPHRGVAAEDVGRCGWLRPALGIRPSFHRTLRVGAAGPEPQSHSRGSHDQECSGGRRHRPVPAGDCKHHTTCGASIINTLGTTPDAPPNLQPLLRKQVKQ